ncbi:hypothetical protein F4802DRAFT_120915 [Xylaria palmicola]|nr:hypothetical protein F4802DRAFT_120915 [Xylaria palmicola]
MSQQRDSHGQDVGLSSQTSGEYDDICSNKATSGSSDPGSDDLGRLNTRSQSSELQPQRPMTRRLRHDLRATRTGSSDIAQAPQGTASSSPGSGSLMDLALSPLPLGMLPNRKRSLDEVLRDESPPQKDKMSVEIDRLAGGEPGQPSSSQASTSGSQNRAQSHRRKKSRTSERPFAPRVIPNIVRGSSQNEEGGVNRPSERRSERLRDASRRGSRPTSD